jgi:hypothetical protein
MGMESGAVADAHEAAARARGGNQAASHVEIGGRFHDLNARSAAAQPVGFQRQRPAAIAICRFFQRQAAAHRIQFVRLGMHVPERGRLRAKAWQRILPRAAIGQQLARQHQIARSVQGVFQARVNGGIRVVGQDQVHRDRFG